MVTSRRNRVYNVIVTRALELGGDTHSVDEHFVIEWSTGNRYVSVLELDYRLYLSTVVLRLHLLRDVRVLPGCQSVDVHRIPVINRLIMLTYSQPGFVGQIWLIP